MASPARAARGRRTGRARLLFQAFSSCLSPSGVAARSQEIPRGVREADRDDDQRGGGGEADPGDAIRPRRGAVPVGARHLPLHAQSPGARPYESQRDGRENRLVRLQQGQVADPGSADAGKEQREGNDAARSRPKAPNIPPTANQRDTVARSPCGVAATELSADGPRVETAVSPIFGTLLLPEASIFAYHAVCSNYRVKGNFQ